jgi:serine/threonine protein kinase
MAQLDHSQFSKLSNFKFRRELGRGAFGRVLLAESKVNGQLYAIKIMSKKNMRWALLTFCYCSSACLTLCLSVPVYLCLCLSLSRLWWSHSTQIRRQAAGAR